MPHHDNPVIGLPIYCLRCRRPTDTLYARAATTEKGQPATSGVCAICDGRKYLLGYRPEQMLALGR